ncbi:MAG: restriction endonuclease subunit S [Archaeoglobaceae archaeon]
MKIEFYKETEFKDTEIGRIPKDWEVSKLEKVLTFKNGRRPVISENGNIPIFGANGIMGFTNDFLVENDFTLVIGRVGASGQVHLGKGKLWVSDNAIYTEKYDKEIIYLPFLYYLLIYKKLNQYSSKTTHPIITQTFLNNFFVSFPPLLEQKAIAEILSTVDEAIQKTNEVIAKTERLKRGLMQELLTKGIGHKEFKDTEIGRIPKDWEVVRLGNIAKIIMGQSPSSSTYNKESKGLPFLQGKMDFGELYPTPILYCSQPIKVAEPNDILISVRAPVGDVNVAPFKLCIGRGLAAIRFNPQRAIYWFYFYYLQKIKNFLENLGKGSTFKAITKDDLENLKIPYLSFPEQQKIAEILSTVDKKLEIERKEKAKLERIKQGLMDLLLTGKVRIKLKET